MANDTPGVSIYISQGASDTWNASRQKFQKCVNHVNNKTLLFKFVSQTSFYNYAYISVKYIRFQLVIIGRQESHCNVVKKNVSCSFINDFKH